MDNLIKDWWSNTKKDFKGFIDSIPFIISVAIVVYFVGYSSPTQTQLIHSIIDSRSYFIMAFMGFGILICAIIVEKVIRFIITSLWFILSCTVSYLYRKIKS